MSARAPTGPTRPALPMLLIVAWMIVGPAACLSEHQPASPSDAPCSIPVLPDLPGATVVLIRQFAFEPAEVRVKAGGRIAWINCERGSTGHTTTADTGAWASPLLDPGDAFVQIFDTPGTFSYHCTPHPFMVARVTVE